MTEKAEMLSVAQAARRQRRYQWFSRWLTWTPASLLLLSGLKGLCWLTHGYLDWGFRPFAYVGYGTQWLCYQVQALAWIGPVFEWVPAFVPPWSLIHPMFLVCVSMIISGGFAQRASLYLKRELTKAREGAQQARWQAELLGQVPAHPHVTNVGTHIHIHSAPSVSPGPWWTRPVGLFLIPLFSGGASAVLGQYLNIALGLGH
ncbi:hypothetical protein [Eleftheria terrae]|uniref:hypothetical protein n=1 Tax=Eleftheria terrae TaxID=1597781 RepID=UPI00263AF1D1|nr:hypothetical protein [Eleftheria terrae]WKB50780.1 hypothetical protein N7L95_13230 [Eleftheria terrae]